MIYWMNKEKREGISRTYASKYKQIHQSFLQYHIAFFTKNNIPFETKEINFIRNYFKNVSLSHEFKIMGMEFDMMTAIFFVASSSSLENFSDWS